LMICPTYCNEWSAHMQQRGLFTWRRPERYHGNRAEKWALGVDDPGLEVRARIQQSQCWSGAQEGIFLSSSARAAVYGMCRCKGMCGCWAQMAPEIRRFCARCIVYLRSLIVQWKSEGDAECWKFEERKCDHFGRNMLMVKMQDRRTIPMRVATLTLLSHWARTRFATRKRQTYQRKV
jgi:hypothetical protein